ncbi:hypothetical protein [Microbacterium paludicola]|uniref:Uncharacterized protein n=1 Tax=Microbacterium paludicola TaxID=300019 RepID=A0A4Y9FUD8_9MICO|nr:hypothetical protein [Microbacterium paludicola]MBF0816381.1 hypothetical protein [Microbacterium paludicola]TFU32918.1 hypothetical protein E4U02_08160 [Microbacterium paludicola]
MNSTPENIDPTRDERGPEDDLVSEDPDLSTGEDPTVDEGPAAEAPDEDGLAMADAPSRDQGEQSEHPSQAEGEDPSDPADASVLPDEGHPSQAEG